MILVNKTIFSMDFITRKFLNYDKNLDTLLPYNPFQENDPKTHEK